jgi:hypothetical protein
MGTRRSTGTRCGPSSSLVYPLRAYPRQAVPPMVTLPAPASYSAFASTATTTTTTLRQAHPAPLGCSPTKHVEFLMATAAEEPARVLFILNFSQLA